MSNIKKRIQELEILVEYHNYKYWVENNPEISDPEYDLLEQELKELDPNNELFQKIYDIKINYNRRNKLGKIKRENPMLSLDKVYSIEDLFNWCEKVSRSQNETFLMQPKLDGVSGDYSNGILSTRGDGYVGENITDKLPLIRYCGANDKSALGLLKINTRGEIIISKQKYEYFKDKILKSDGTQYKSPRGLCSGILMRDDVDSNLNQILDFIDFNTYSQTYTLEEIKKINFKEIEKQIKNWEYDVDGLVFKLSDEEYSKTLGFTSHHPKGQIAFKFSNPSAETKLIGIEWSVGKHTITPVGLVETVEINNANISRVSLHNGKFLIDKNLCIGDYVVIERSGEIIPHIVSVRPGENRQQIILEECPRCGGEVGYEEPEVVCLNPNCKGSDIKKLHDSIIRLGIENLGPSTIQKLYDYGVKNIIDIFNISFNDIMSLEGFKDKSAENLFNEINKIKNSKIEDWRILSSLNLKGIGTSLSKKLLNKFTLDEIRSMSSKELENINDMGPERAKILEEGLYENEEILDGLIEIFPDIIDSKDKQIKGTICFTGKGNKKREYYKKIAEQNGYRSVNSVGKDLTYLVTNDLNSNSGKMKKARKYGVQIITYKDFE